MSIFPVYSRFFFVKLQASIIWALREKSICSSAPQSAVIPFRHPIVGERRGEEADELDWTWEDTFM
jgi:hypothetical protein